MNGLKRDSIASIFPVQYFRSEELLDFLIITYIPSQLMAIMASFSLKSVYVDFCTLLLLISCNEVVKPAKRRYVYGASSRSNLGPTSWFPLVLRIEVVVGQIPFLLVPS